MHLYATRVNTLLLLRLMYAMVGHKMSGVGFLQFTVAV
ncbi:uncharacterized protein DEA37_0005221 [Paragonimus westermani]|uniref:Uncharacterized protein n=1 Tax=Paragonimus westermani TaxID=34504 RepID=A0A5J4ND84_9TREM|nr:uncharacterized protein DEA37_0005221 [Paragonimus westermani]